VRYQTQWKCNLAVFGGVEGLLYGEREVQPLGSAEQVHGLIDGLQGLETELLAVRQVLTGAVIVVWTDNPEAAAQRGMWSRCHRKVAHLVDGVAVAVQTLLGDNHRQDQVLIYVLLPADVDLHRPELHQCAEGQNILRRAQHRLLVEAVVHGAGSVQQQVAAFPALLHFTHTHLKVGKCYLFYEILIVLLIFLYYLTQKDGKKIPTFK